MEFWLLGVLAKDRYQKLYRFTNGSLSGATTVVRDWIIAHPKETEPYKAFELIQHVVEIDRCSTRGAVAVLDVHKGRL
jgi:hypothetical protein